MEPNAGSFWFQPRRRPLLNPVALILTIPIIALLILFFVIHPFISHTNQILRPNSVKKSWDSLNILLVLFAVLCGIFARRNDDDRPIAAAANVCDHRPSQSVPAWIDFPDRREYNSNFGGGRLRRSSSSYPDMRQESVWEIEGANRNRFMDDFEFNFYTSPPPPRVENYELRQKRHEAEAEAEAEIHVDKFEVAAPPEHMTPPPPQPNSIFINIFKSRRYTHPSAAPAPSFSRRQLGFCTPPRTT
ncbi:uncharacterized protein LOC121810352 [Salvia splendens]|uniref:uncharacterized protein LOC121810352 n=1 Tax=Salvia splendens TaxID=180675 RepID=UPI001C253278|nr:uncharacterized protein LOC121810352 [Salvia splendens]